MIRLVINNDTSQKFWQIHKNSNKKIIEINWGKIGGKSRTKQEPYESSEQADINIKKQIEKKMLKGYRLETNSMNTPKAPTPVPVKQPTPVPVKQPTPKQNSFSAVKKTQKRKRCPNGMRRNEKGDCVSKDGKVAKVATPKAPTPKAPTPKAPIPKAPTPKAPTPKAPTPKAPTPKAPTPKAPTPMPVKKTQKRKRCPNGMRRDENGDCVPKNAEITTSTSIKDTVKKCPPGKVFNPNTGKCIKDKYGFLAYLMAKNSNSNIGQQSTKAPTPKAPTPKAPTPEKKTQKRKRCPNGMRRDENGDCVSKTVKQNNSKIQLKANKPLEKKSASIAKPQSNKNQNQIHNQNDQERVAVYDVIKNGVMLAHTYKDPKTGKLKNPPKGFPAAPKGWYASEKFDGYRAIWDGKDFRSRTGKVFAAPEWFKSWLPSGIALDGELFMGRECFEKCGIFRKKVPDDKEWKSANVTYQIFDVPSMKVPFEERMEELNKLVKKLCKQNEGVKDCPLRITKQVKVETEEEVFKMFDNLVEKGAEGVMLRSPKSPYDPKRSAHLLKVKPFFDAECSIIGYKPGTGKYSGKLGAFHCETVKEPKTKFFISGMTDEVRENYKKTHPIGTKVTYTYVGVNESGVPRHPNYLRKREAE